MRPTWHCPRQQEKPWVETPPPWPINWTGHGHRLCQPISGCKRRQEMAPRLLYALHVDTTITEPRRVAEKAGPPLQPQCGPPVNLYKGLQNLLCTMPNQACLKDPQQHVCWDHQMQLPLSPASPSSLTCPFHTSKKKV